MEKNAKTAMENPCASCVLYAEMCQGVPLLKALEVQLPRLCSLPLATQATFNGCESRFFCAP